MKTGGLGGRAEELRRDRIPFVHARVVLAERPTSAKAGDEAIVLSDGSMEGFVGGACAETTVRSQSLAVLGTGTPLLLRVSPTEEPPQQGKLTMFNPCLSGGSLEIFLEPVIPPAVLVVHGETPIGRALSELAPFLGFRAVGWEGELERDATAVVVASHGHGELELLTAALAAQVPYIALVASAKRGSAVIAELDLEERDRARIHTPAGLDIGALTPPEVALSILAEIISTRPRSSGEEPEPALADSQATTAQDPVCSMAVAMVEVSLHLDHQGIRYWFCGEGCLKAFAADPGRYLPA